MKKMNFASVSCEIAVADNFYFSTESICEYGRDTVRYAVERFFAKNIGLQRKCTWESWKIRVGKGSEKNRQRFTYVFPAPVMELPGEWVRVAGMIDSRRSLHQARSDSARASLLCIRSNLNNAANDLTRNAFPREERNGIP